MLNQFVLMGKMKKKLEIKENNGERIGIMFLSIPKEYEKEDSEHIVVEIIMYGNMIDNVKEYCEKGNLVGVKGRISALDNKTIIVAEKITFLSSRKDS